MKKKDIYGVKVDSCPDLFDHQIVRRFVFKRAIPQGFSSTHGIFHSGRGFGCIPGNFKYIYFGNQN